MPKIHGEWTVTTPPPEGDPDVGLWAYSLFELSMLEKDRLGLPERWFENHRLFRGDHWNKNRRPWLRKRDRDKISVNLIFANVQRTVANLTGRNPTVEIHSTDDNQDDAERLFTQQINNWWNETEQATVLATSAQVMENYGITIEKHVMNVDNGDPENIVIDPYSWFPAPGYFADIQDMPFIGQAYPLGVDEVEALFGVVGVEPDDAYSLLGEDREDNRQIPAGSRYGVMNAPGNYATVLHPVKPSRDYRVRRALVIEMWVRDRTMELVLVETFQDPLSGAITYEESSQLKYPGGIRKITVTNRGRLVLDDSPNPNVNEAIPREIQEKTYGYWNFPFSKANSYEDSTSIWGFAAAEQVGDIQLKIDDILSNIASYIRLCCKPPLILPRDTGVKADSITNQAALLIEPVSGEKGSGIRFLQVPALPSDFWRLLDLYINFFDRIYAIQDVDRGTTPQNITAASAIITLQERNAVLMRHKIRATDYLVRERGRWAISHYQNFGWQPKRILLEDQPAMFRGTDYAGRQFNFVVESGSTVSKTNLQIMEDAKDLYAKGVIDRQALLEAVNFPNWKAILERTAEGQLGQALQVLVQAGLPQEVAMQLQQQLAMTQGGPGNLPQTPVPANGQPTMLPGPRPGTPRAMQGQVQPSMEQMQPPVQGV